MSMLTSDAALNATGYFDEASVRHLMQLENTLKAGSARRGLVEQVLANVVMTQLWHHTFIEDLGVPFSRFAVTAPEMKFSGAVS